MGEKHQTWIPTPGYLNSRRSPFTCQSVSIIEFLKFIFLSSQQSPCFFSFWTKDKLLVITFFFFGMYLDIHFMSGSVWCICKDANFGMRKKGLQICHWHQLETASLSLGFFHASHKKNDSYPVYFNKYIVQSKMSFVPSVYLP